MTFPTPEIAQAVADELGIDHARRVRLARLLEHGAPARAADRQRQGLPVRLRVLRHEGVDYRPGMLPATDALLARSMSIGIGVFDTNLAPFGLRMRTTTRPRRGAWPSGSARSPVRTSGG